MLRLVHGRHSGVAREELNEDSVAAASSATDCEVPAEGGGCLAFCTFPALSQPVLYSTKVAFAELWVIPGPCPR